MAFALLLTAAAVDGKPRVIIGMQFEDAKDANATEIPTLSIATEAPSSEVIGTPTVTPSEAKEESAVPTMAPSSIAVPTAAPTAINLTPAPSVSTDAPTEAPFKTSATAVPTAMLDNNDDDDPLPTPVPSSVPEDDPPSQSPSARVEETPAPTIATSNEAETPVLASPTGTPIGELTAAPSSNTTLVPSSTTPGTTPIGPAPTDVPVARTNAPTGSPKDEEIDDDDDEIPIEFPDRNETMDNDGFDQYEFDDDDSFLGDKNETMVPSEDFPTLAPEEDFDFNATDAPSDEEDIQPDVTVPPTSHTTDEIEIDGDIILTPSPTGSAYPTSAPTTDPTVQEDIETSVPSAIETATPTVAPSTPSIAVTDSPTTAAPTINVNFVQLPTDGPTPAPIVNIVQQVPTVVPTTASTENEKPSCHAFLSSESPIAYPIAEGGVPLTPHHQYMVDNVVRPTSSGLLPGGSGEVGCDEEQEPLPNQELPVTEGPVQTSAFLPGQRRLRGRQP